MARVYHSGIYLLTHLSLDKMPDISQMTFSNAFIRIKKAVLAIKIPLTFVPKGPTNNNPASVQIMAGRRLGDKPLSEPMMTRFTDAYQVSIHHYKYVTGLGSMNI